jgi:hypothetical protein
VAARPTGGGGPSADPTPSGLGLWGPAVWTAPHRHRPES